MRTPETVPTNAHGKDSTYINYRCRCAACKKAHADYERGRWNRRKRRGVWI